MYILCHENTNMSIFFHFSCTFIFNMILLLKIFMEVTLMEEKKNIEIISSYCSQKQVKLFIKTQKENFIVDNQKYWEMQKSKGLFDKSTILGAG